MAGYGPVAMVRTPWGDAGTLRDRKLRPGRRLPREEVARNQRERLFAAMVAVVAEKGYEATRVADLVELSGVSRSAFYAHFSDKKECLLAAAEALRRADRRRDRQAERRPPPDEERARQAFEAFLDLIVDQPAASKMCFVEIYAAGPEGGRRDRPRARRLRRRSSRPRSSRSPAARGCRREMVRAMIGGLQKVIHKRLYRDEAGGAARAGAADLRLVALLPAAARPLRAAAQPRGQKRAAFAERQATNPAERVLRALASIVAEKGYPATTVAEIVDRASTSQRTFYAQLRQQGRGDAGRRSTAARRRCWRRPCRPSAAPPTGSTRCAAPTRRCSPSAPKSPSTRRSARSTIYAAGKRALETARPVMKGMEALLVPGYERKPDASPIAAEAIGGAIYSMIYDQVKRGGAESMQEIAPMATYITLAPFIGAEEACAVANGDGRGR